MKHHSMDIPVVIQLLWSHGANLDAMNDERNTTLRLAARNGQLAAAQLLVGETAIGVQNKGGWTPLHEASFHGYSDIIMLLLDERMCKGDEHVTSLRCSFSSYRVLWHFTYTRDTTYTIL